MASAAPLCRLSGALLGRGLWTRGFRPWQWAFAPPPGLVDEPTLNDAHGHGTIAPYGNSSCATITQPVLRRSLGLRITIGSKAPQRFAPSRVTKSS